MYQTTFHGVNVERPEDLRAGSREVCEEEPAQTLPRKSMDRPVSLVNPIGSLIVRNDEPAELPYSLEYTELRVGSPAWRG
jgi:hypothetical protein